MRNKEFESHIKHFTLWELQWKEDSPKCLALETNGAYIQGTERTVGNRDSAFKGIMHRLTYPRTQNKSSTLKST